MFHLLNFDLQERVREHDGQGKDQKKAEGGVDEGDIEGSLPEFRWVGDKDRQVWIYKQHDEDTEEDSRSEEPPENLAEADISQTASRGRMSIPM